MTPVIDRLALARAEFRALLALPDETLPLWPAARAIGAVLQRGDTWVGADQALVDLERRVHVRVSPLVSEGPRAMARELIAVVRDAGFDGDDPSHDSVDNVFVDRVLERRRGMPLALSLVAMRLAERVGLPLHGVPFPGHFLVGVELDGRDPAIFDPYNRGRQLDAAALLELLGTYVRGRVTGADVRAHVRAASAREILARMLRNLQHLYTQSGAGEYAEEATSMLEYVRSHVPREDRPASRTPN